MKKLILSIIPFLLLVSCATVPLDILENDKQLRMVGGKESLLDAIQYPEFALSKGIEGVVTVLAYVDTAGIVRDCKILEGNDYLNDAAVAAMKKQRFHPYVLEGEKRPVRVAIPIWFTISKDIDIREYDRKRIMEELKTYADAPVITLTDYISGRSPGTPSDYYSEALTWWPVHDDPDAPYMIREGEVNPEAFTEHREALMRFAEITSGLTAAYVITGKKDYALKALEHVKAWFIDPETRMSPHVKYARAIPNRNPERVFAIMDALPLADVFRSLLVTGKFLSEDEQMAIDTWLDDYAHYLEYDPMMQVAMQREDNYSLAWLLQIASVARYRNDEEMLDKARYYFKEHSLKFLTEPGTPYLNFTVNQPDMYNIFTAADLVAAITESLSDRDFDAWTEITSGVQRPGDLINAMYSGLLNFDLMIDPDYRGRYNSLLLAGKAYKNSRYLDMWRDLNTGERETTAFPIREVVLWTK
jgi:TonB family protein